MRVFIAIPVFNSSDYILQTIHSIGKASYSAGCQIHVHLQDGGCDDSCAKSIKVITEKYLFKSLSSREASLETDSRRNLITKSRIPDDGMYDALTRAFSTFNLRNYDWITWIGSDDTFSDDSFFRLNLISSQIPEIRFLLSSVGVVDENGSSFTPGFRPYSRDMIASGCADGKTFPYVQQEGSFIRSDLWIKVLKENPFDNFKYAGDWNLWRIAAKYCEPYHLKGSPLAFSHRRKGQKSSDSNSNYHEIEKHQHRAHAVNSAYATLYKSDINLVEILGNGVDAKAKLITCKAPEIFEKTLKSTKLISKIYQSLVKAPKKSETDIITQEGAIIAVNKYWQTPAKTELHAWEKLKDLNIQLTKSNYIGFPWATLIDKLQLIRYIDESDQCLKELTEAFNSLRSSKSLAPANMHNGLKVTACQHILMKKFIWLFKAIGITDIFWSHKVVNEDLIDGIRIHPFPLYPVNALPKLRQKTYSEYEYNFTFIGARANKWYLTNSRNHIFDCYSKNPDSLVIARDKWHFQKSVYEDQVKSNKFGPLESKKNIDSISQANNATKEFINSLDKARFILCPSGSGPNSIRLWESIGSGCVPVILADTYDPPGDYRMWEKACVILDESLNSIKNLNYYISKISEPQWLSAREKISQLNQEYGCATFITDIIRLLLNFESTNVPFVNIHSWSRGGKSKINDPRLNNNNKNPLTKYLITKNIVPSSEIFKPKALLASAKEYQRIFISNDTKKILRICHSIHCIPPVSSAERKIKYILLGRHSNRTPLSYALLHGNHKKNNFAEVFSLQEADIVVTGFNRDIPDILNNFSSDATLDKPIIIMSEEPLWDITWSGFKSFADLSSQTHNHTSSHSCRYFHLNYFNSEIFDFNFIPYFLLTDSKYIARYLLLFKNILKMSPYDLLKYWKSKKGACAFIQEYRENSVDFFNQHDIKSLSAYRCDLATNLKNDFCYIEGKGWTSTASRQDLIDWHLDKLTKLNSNFCFVSAIENVHYSTYVTEKIFDAYASCAIPLYYASDKHYIHKIVPSNSFINMYGLNPEQAAQKVKSFDPDINFAKRYLQDITRIFDTLSKPDLVNNEINRLSTKIRNNLLNFLQ